MLIRPKQNSKGNDDAQFGIIAVIVLFAGIILLAILISSCSVTTTLKRDIHRSEFLYSQIKYLRVDSISEKKFLTEYYLSYPLWNDIYLRFDRYGFGDHHIGDTIKLSPYDKGDLTFVKNGR